MSESKGGVASPEPVHRLRKPGIIPLLSSMGAAQLAESMGSVAFYWWLYDTTGSAWALAAIGIVRSAGYAAGAPVGGVLADRFSRPGTMAVSTLVRAAVALAVALFSWQDMASPGVVVAAAGLFAAGHSLFMPSVDALIPRVAGGRSLTAVNSAHQATHAGTSVGGPALGGMMIALFGLGGTGLGLGALYLTAAVLTLGLRPFHQPTAEVEGMAGSERERESVWAQAVDGVRYIRSQYITSLLVGFTALLNLVVMPVFIVLPVLTMDVLQLTAVHYGWLEGALPVGVLLGSLGATLLPAARRKAPRALTAVMFTGLMYASVAYARNFESALAPLVLMGTGMALASVLGRVILQEQVADDHLGRVFGLMNGLSATVQPLGMAVAGAAMEFWGPGAVAAGSGLIVLLAAGIALMIPASREV